MVYSPSPAAIVHDALEVYRKAMRRFVVASLAPRSTSWFEEYALPAFHNSSLRRRIEQSAAEMDEPEQLLGIKRCFFVVQYHWSDVFAEQFGDESTLATMEKVRDWRNVVAHERITHYVAREALDDMHRVLEQIDDQATRQIEAMQALIRDNS